MQLLMVIWLFYSGQEQTVAHGMKKRARQQLVVVIWLFCSGQGLMDVRGIPTH
jgi:hypothetical protein